MVCLVLTRIRVNCHNHIPGKRITFQGNWSLISLSPDYFRLARIVRLRQTSREGPWQGPPLPRSLSPAVLPGSFVGAGTTPSRSCEQPTCRSEAAFASSSSDYAPVRMLSRSSFSPVNMQQILQRHTSVYCQQHLPNRPSAFDTACLLNSRG